MDVPADRSRPTSALPLQPDAVRSPPRRRPTGAAPPLPYRLQTSGIGWLVAALVLIGLTLAIFARGLRGPGGGGHRRRRRGRALAGRPGQPRAGGAAAGPGPRRLLVGAVHPVVRPDAGVAGPAPLAAPAAVVGRRQPGKPPHGGPDGHHPAATPLRGGPADQLGWLGAAVDTVT